MKKPKTKSNDWRGIPTAICPQCGSDWFRLSVKFDYETYEVAMWGLSDAQCLSCSSYLTPPTPLDHPDFKEGQDYVSS